MEDPKQVVRRGYDVLSHRWSFVPEGSGGHTLFWTHRLSGT
ncbi:hypothetical protein [Kribbella sp. C-35]